MTHGSTNRQIEKVADIAEKLREVSSVDRRVQSIVSISSGKLDRFGTAQPDGRFQEQTAFTPTATQG